MVRIALGEDSLIVREGLRRLLDSDPSMEIVAAVGDVASLREVCERDRPDVVLSDIRMPPSHTDEGIRLAAELRETHPEMGVVILSQFADPIYALALLDRGSDRRAYLLKERVQPRRADRGDRGGGRRWVDDRPEDRRGARARPRPGRSLAAQRAHRA